MLALAFVLRPQQVASSISASDGGAVEARTKEGRRPPISTPTGLSGLLRVHPTNARYFTDDGSRAVYLTGSHTWQNVQDRFHPELLTFNWTTYLNQLQSWGHNFIRLWVWEGHGYDSVINLPQLYARPGSGTALDDTHLTSQGEGPGLLYELTLYDQTYYDRLRQRVIDAGARGMFASVMLFQGWSVCHSTNMFSWHPYNAGMNSNGVDGDADDNGAGEVTCSTSMPPTEPTEAWWVHQRNYVKKVVDTLNDLDNFMYEVSNEAGCCTTDTQSMNWQTAVKNYLRSYEAGKPKQHLVVVGAAKKANVSGHAYNLLLYNSDADVVAPSRITATNSGNPDEMKGGRCSGGSNSGAACSVPSQCPGGSCAGPPALGTTYALKPSFLDTDHISDLSAMPDTTGVDWAWKAALRGYQPLYMDGWGDWGSTPSQALRDNLGYIRSYIERMTLASTVPSTTLTSTGYCLAHAGTSHLTYQPASGAWTIDLTGQTGTYGVEWWDIMDKQVESGGGGTTSVAGGGVRMLTPPSSITGAAAAFLEIEATPMETAAPTPTETPTPTPTGTFTPPPPTATPTLTFSECERTIASASSQLARAETAALWLIERIAQ